MPVVPFTPQTPEATAAAAQPDDVWLAIATAGVHEQGRLFAPQAPDLYETRPQASLGGRSPVEVNNSELGPSETELNQRQKTMEKQRQDFNK